MHTTLNFVRMDRFQVDALAQVTLDVADGDLSKQEVMDRLQAALTQWGSTTEEGREAWRQSSEDFNVGDLANYADSGGDSGLGAILKEHGLVVVDIDTTSFKSDFEYDTVLMHPNN